jgi:ribosomal protein L4
MAIVKFYDIKGKVIDEQEVPFSFELKPNDMDLLARAIKRQLANARRNYAHTKIRSEVRGGGAKLKRNAGARCRLV